MSVLPATRVTAATNAPLAITAILSAPPATVLLRGQTRPTVTVKGDVSVMNKDSAPVRVMLKVVIVVSASRVPLACLLKMA